LPLYQYKARDREGNLRTGTIEAGRKEAVAEQVQSHGLIPVSIEERESASGLSFGLLAAGFQRIDSRDIILFSRQLSTLVSAGIPLLQSMTTIDRQLVNPRLKAIVAEVRADLERGTSLSDALSRHPAAFSGMYVSMVRAGETAGILDDVLDRLSTLAEHDADTRARVQTAVRYPLIVVIAVCAAFAFLVSFVIPKFAAIFARFKTELPFPTRLLIGINQAVQNHWFFLLIGIVALAAAVAWYLKTPVGRRQWDQMKLKLPVFGPLFHKVALSRFARVFSALQKSGLPMDTTLEIVAGTVGNVVIARVVEDLRDQLRQGATLEGPMEASGLFPPLVIQMTAVGGESGNLDVMLHKVSEYYDRDVEYTLRNLSTMIEPILLLFVGGMVLFLALGIFLPMWDMMTLFRK